MAQPSLLKTGSPNLNSNHNGPSQGKSQHSRKVTSLTPNTLVSVFSAVVWELGKTSGRYYTAPYFVEITSTVCSCTHRANTFSGKTIWKTTIETLVRRMAQWFQLLCLILFFNLVSRRVPLSLKLVSPPCFLVFQGCFLSTQESRQHSRARWAR